MKRLWALVAVCVAVVVMVVVMGIDVVLTQRKAYGASASERGDWYRTRAVAALERVQAGDDGAQRAFQYGSALMASGELYGWQDPQTVYWLQRLLSKRKVGTTCGYGLDTAYDVGKDGTSNPVNSLYLVSVANHAGMPLLSAYLGGTPGVTRDDVQCMVNMVVRWPRVTVPVGACLAYSNQVPDRAWCVHNVNTGAARFLSDANRVGFGAGGMQKLITNIFVYESSVYRDTIPGWTYKSGDATPDDPDHQSFTGESMINTVFWLGREVVYQGLYRTSASTDTQAMKNMTAIAHLRLASGLFGPQWPGTTTADGGSLWCDMADVHQSEMDAWLSRSTGDQTAQWAMYGAQAARVCA